MLSRLRAEASVYGALFAQMLKVRLAYKGDFIAELVATGLGGVATLLFVVVLFLRVPDLAGWSRDEILFIFGLSMTSYGMFGTISWNLYQFGERYVIEGRFDRVLLRPASTYLQVVCDSFRIPALSESLIGAGVTAYAAHRLGLQPSLVGLVYLFAVVVSGAVIFTAVFSILAAVSFRFEDRVGISPPVFNLIGFSRFPQTIFPYGLRFLLRWVIPFGFVAYYPSTILLGKDRFTHLALLAPAVALTFSLLTVAVWRAGVRRYESTGS